MYFFIDPANLTLQTANDAYGPLSTDLTNIYNTTSRFQLINEARAFACQGGSMIVQQSTEDDSLVNLIIKPTKNLDIPLEVEYYIYRGILKNSLINDDGTTCEIQIFNNTTSNDLIRRMRQDANITNHNCDRLGYDNSLLDSALLDELLQSGGSQYVPHIWVYEGEWIGTFTKDYKIGFEIVLKSDFNNLNLGFLRAPNNQINVTSLTGFEQRVKREDILKFIDPAAFFGMHHLKTVDYYVSGATNNKETTSKNASSSRFIYTKLLNNFHTKNKVYVDIRSEKGYSYNFYQNYKVSNTDSNNIQIRPESGTGVLNSQEYLTNSWPILIIESTHNSGSTNKLRLKLKISSLAADGITVVSDNTKPILYSITELKKSLLNNNKLKSNYIKTKGLIDNGTNPDHTDWTNEFRIFFPNTQYNTGGNSNRNCIGNYVRLHYFRTKHNANNTNTSVLENTHYYDSAFCSIDIIRFDTSLGNLDLGEVESTSPIYVREPLHLDANHTDYDANYNLEGTGNFELNMINGAYWGSSKVLMYAKIEYENTAKTSQKEYLNTYDQDLSSFTQGPKYRSFREDLKIICREYNITGNTGSTKILGINFFKSSDLSVTGKHKENLMLLGLTIDEMISIKADTQLSNGHQRFIHLEPLDGNPLQDNSTNNNRYFAYRVRLQGFDNNQSSDIVTPQHNGNDIIVYSRDNQFFSSYEFSKDEIVTSGENRVEFHIYNDGVIKINDNIDMALIHDIQNIYYRYRATDNEVFTDICNLDLIMANKMRRVDTNVTGVIPPVGFVQFHDYSNDGVTGVDATRTYENEDGDIITEGSGNTMRYDNQDKKKFMVHFTPTSINNVSLGIDFSFTQTLRHYANPSLAAAVIGVLIRVDFATISAGFAYSKGSCYPSGLHVNGESIDTSYLVNLQDNVDFILGLKMFGFTHFRIANTFDSRSNNIYSHNSFENIRTIFSRDRDCKRVRANVTKDCAIVNGVFTRKKVLNSLHKTHLHSEKVKLNDGNKVL